MLQEHARNRVNEGYSLENERSSGTRKKCAPILYMNVESLRGFIKVYIKKRKLSYASACFENNGRKDHLRRHEPSMVVGQMSIDLTNEDTAVLMPDPSCDCHEVDSGHHTC